MVDICVPTDAHRQFNDLERTKSPSNSGGFFVVEWSRGMEDHPWHFGRLVFYSYLMILAGTGAGACRAGPSRAGTGAGAGSLLLGLNFIPDAHRVRYVVKLSPPLSVSFARCIFLSLPSLLSFSLSLKERGGGYRAKREAFF